MQAVLTVEYANCMILFLKPTICWKFTLNSEKESESMEREEEQGVKKAYSSPAIAKFGAISRLTQGSAGGMMDANGFSGVAMGMMGGMMGGMMDMM